MQRTIVAAIVVLLLATGAPPALAGGWATVRLDAPPEEVTAGVPWRFGFMVLQHGVTPISDVTPVVRATHTETGETVTATGIREGPVGHFVAELTLPTAGAWEWEIAPDAFAATSFEQLRVIDEADARASSPGYRAKILAGTCATPGDVAVEVGRLAMQPAATESLSAPLARIIPISDISAKSDAGGAANQLSAADSGDALACGDVLLPLVETTIVSLQPETGSDVGGVAVLSAFSDDLHVTLYALPLIREPIAAKTIEMRDDWSFQPRLLEAAPGTAVTWVNTSATAHTVTGADLAFPDSGLIEPGQSFSLIFDEPDTYRVRCVPHPGMEGVIVIA